MKLDYVYQVNKSYVHRVYGSGKYCVDCQIKTRAHNKKGEIFLSFKDDYKLVDHSLIERIDHG
jgi:hypothetical protein